MLVRRCTGAMPSRMAMTFVPSRLFSTSLPPRMPSNPPPTRSNPLVGNIFAPEPARSTSEPKSSPLSPPPPPPPPPASSSSSSPSPASKSPFAYNALDPLPIIDIANLISEKSAAYARDHRTPVPAEQPVVRTKAVAGRTVFIKDRLGPQSAPTPMVALRVLDKMCRDQKIRTKFHTQKFHERKGLKKKRLRSQRWRARFKTGFKAAVSRVIELKKQGW